MQNGHLGLTTAPWFLSRVFLSGNLSTIVLSSHVARKPLSLTGVDCSCALVLHKNKGQPNKALAAAISGGYKHY